MMLKVDERIVFVSSRGETRWALDPARWLRDGGARVVVLQVSLLRSGRLQVVPEQKVRIGVAGSDPPAP